MKKLVIIAAITIVVLLGGSLWQNREKPTFVPTMQTITLRSTVFSSGQAIPKAYTCDGANINPPITISDVPPDTKSIALIMEDPDAPSGTFTHWLVWNIPPGTKEIASGVAPEGATIGNNDFGQSSYDGPCPPEGSHRYFFRIYGLDTKLSLTPDTKRKRLEEAFAGHILGQGELMGTYAR